MDPWFALFLLLAVGVLAALVIMASRGFSTLMQHFKGAPGSWNSLVAVYPTTKPPPAPVLHRQTLVIGRTLYRRCIEVSASEDGLYLKFGFPLSLFRRLAVLIPWKEFKHAEEGRLYWRKAVLLRVGDPMIGTLTVPNELFAQICSQMSVRPGDDAPSAGARLRD